ncbi:MFS transporter, partial [Escherichia coli]|nr:MFS transporter [Escherichia coli]
MYYLKNTNFWMFGLFFFFYFFIMGAYFPLMNPLMILVKIIKLRWIHIL